MCQMFLQKNIQSFVVSNVTGLKPGTLQVHGKLGDSFKQIKLSINRKWTYGLE